MSTSTPKADPLVESAARLTRLPHQPRLGESLIKARLLSPRQLESAAALAERSGLRLGEAVVSLGYASEAHVAAHLAAQYALPFRQLLEMEFDHDLARLIPKDFVWERRALPLGRVADQIVLGIVDPLDRGILSDVTDLTGLSSLPVLVTQSGFLSAYEQRFQDDHVRFSVSDLLSRFPEDSASHVLSSEQKRFFLCCLVVSAAACVLDPRHFLVMAIALVNLIYLVITVYKLHLIHVGQSSSTNDAVPPGDVATLDDRQLPTYTILIPLYKETTVLPTLIKAMQRLDYPKAKLDVKLLLEEDDLETIAVARSSYLPSYFHVVVVPHGSPKGKPKACNYGLSLARGRYVVIYDAEDVPEPDQLKKAVVAFQRGGDHLACVQGKLNYYNPYQNLLTRWFASEYSMWFDLILPGLCASQVPIPLGGTSNHFPTNILKDLGGWDPYNVTEDADLGIRLFKHGYVTTVIDSTTWEEANSNVPNWIRQRSRWTKGYMQTWLVHMRHPIQLYQALGAKGFLSFQATVGGTFFVVLLNPIFWVLTGLWFLTRSTVIGEFFPAPVFFLGSVSLVIGNFVYIYSSMMGCVSRNYHAMVKYNVLLPVYWALMSLAAWKGLIQLVRNPWYWEKTAHGLYKGPVFEADADGSHGLGATSAPPPTRAIELAPAISSLPNGTAYPKQRAEVRFDETPDPVHGRSNDLMAPDGNGRLDSR